MNFQTTSLSSLSDYYDKFSAFARSQSAEQAESFPFQDWMCIEMLQELTQAGLLNNNWQCPEDGTRFAEKHPLYDSSSRFFAFEYSMVLHGLPVNIFGAVVDDRPFCRLMLHLYLKSEEGPHKDIILASRTLDPSSVWNPDEIAEYLGDRAEQWITP